MSGLSLNCRKGHIKELMIDSTKKGNDTNIPGGRITLRILEWAIVCLVFIAFTPSQGFSANFSVSPTSLDLSSIAKSGAFSVINSGEDKLTCQIDVKEWAQDAEGKDVYTDTKDIVFFPKIMTVEPNEQRAVRIGIKGPLSAKEKTYRFFVEEIPSQKKEPEGKGTGKITAGLTIAFQYSMPIFVKPIRQQESGIIEKIEMSGGTARVVIRNTGNVHFKLLSVKFRGKAADGAELFSKEFTGWYVLHGLARSYAAVVPRDVCDKLSTIEIKAQAENFGISGNMNVLKTMCLQ
jgi:fimbrial chaperone protein